MVTQDLILGQGSQYPLKAKLTLPDDLSTPVPAVVLVHGSGSSNMDEKIYKLTPFKDLAEGLAEHGIAALRYDKRSFTHGLKMIRSKAPITVKEETIEDAVLAAELLRQDPRIDPERIFIVGHSMGAMLAPRIDAEGGNFRGLILMAGTPRTLEQVMLGQFADILPTQKGLAGRILKKQAEKIASQFQGLYDLTDEQAKKVKMGNGTTLYYFKEMGEHPASGYLEKLEKPVLILQGDKDFQVKLREDYDAYRALLEGKPNVTFRLYEGLNHAFVPAICEDIAMARQEYSRERHIGENVIGDIAGWIRGNC
jgi:dienelactone hydrolase